MEKTVALIIGVPIYSDKKYNKLKDCCRDVKLIEENFIDNLKIDRENIILFGKMEKQHVNLKRYEEAIEEIKKSIQEDDIFIFYFTGHGNKICEKGNEKHALIFSDKALYTESLIESLNKVKCKCKILILDCCYSNHFTNNQNFKDNILENIGDEYAIFSSSTFESYISEEIKSSVFTHNLCEALNDKTLIKNGKIYLKDIHELLSLNLKEWNKTNKKEIHDNILNLNTVEQIYFKVDKNRKYYQKEPNIRAEEYVGYVEDVSFANLKRLSIKIILKEDLEITKNKIEKMNFKIKEIVFKEKIQNKLWIYFYKTEKDYINNINIYCSEWDDKNGFSIRENKNYNQFNDVLTNISKNDKNELIKERKIIMIKAIELAEKFVEEFKRYEENILDEKELCLNLEKINIFEEIENLYNQLNNLEIVKIEIKEFDNKCFELMCLIDNFKFCYGNELKNERTVENRKSYGKILVKHYNDKKKEFFDLLPKVYINEHL